MKLLKQGSVKDIYQPDSEDHLVFTFSDRYSVFDWGEMPDHLTNKGKTLAFLCSLFFKELEKEVPTHFISPLDENMKAVDDLFSVGNSILVEKCYVPKVPFVEGRYDYSFYKQKTQDSLVPLEVIFRYGLPSGSSLLKRLDDREYLEELGLESVPKKGSRFQEPIIEFSTKLEKSDRYLSLNEAQSLSGMSDEEIHNLKELSKSLSRKLKSLFEDIGIELWDGKFEFSFSPPHRDQGPRTFKLVDSLGPDELRLLSTTGTHLSKEFLRSYYHNSNWALHIERAKKLAKDRGVADWKSICLKEMNASPSHLPGSLKQRAEWIYQALCNALAKKTLFPHVPPLEDLMKKYTGKHVVVVGSGGREHALSWKLAQSPFVEKVTVIPGNEGMSLTSKVDILPTTEILPTILSMSPDLVVIGPEKYLVEGIVNTLLAHNIATFGPTKEASLLESSKVFMKESLIKSHLPTASYKVASSVEEAQNILNAWPTNCGIVIKSDELSGGKGVFVCKNKEDALKACKNLLSNKNFSVKARRVVIEEELIGEELSSFYLCDGDRAYYLASAKDYKRIFDRDQGPNTGGMGGHIPENRPSREVQKELDRIADTTLAFMKDRGTPYQGVLFIGSMIVENRPIVLEFNVRFGDPEAQIILPALKNDFFEILCNIVNKKGLKQKIHLSRSVHVVVSSKGYPSLDHTPIITGLPISFENQDILEEKDDRYLFMAGVKRENDIFVNTGGRVLGVTAVADKTEDAREKSYAAVRTISFEGMHYRKDIAKSESQWKG